MSVAVVGSYDNFNALQAQKYYEWAVADPRVIGIVIFPWGGAQKYLPLDGGAYVGLNVMLGPELQPNATATWAAFVANLRAASSRASLPVRVVRLPRCL